MNKLQANLCLICVTLYWSSEVIIYKCIPDGISSFAITGMTNAIAAIVLAACFFKRLKAELKRSSRKLILRCLLLGAMNCGYNVLYLQGLDYLDVSTGAFTFSMTIVVLPVILLTMKKSVDKKTWISAALVLVGITVALGSTSISLSYFLPIIVNRVY